MGLLVKISRILVGSLFIVSGLIKANDPLGFSYKLAEYFAADVLGWTLLEPYALEFSIIISVFEIALGFLCVLGAFMNIGSWSYLGMIVFFTFLTFYSAYFNKVTDCGCFGDALKLTPWQSFTKDVVLLVFILIMFIRRKKIKINTKGEDVVMVIVSLLTIAWFGWKVIHWQFPLVFAIAVFIPILVLKYLLPANFSKWMMLILSAGLSLYFALFTYKHLPIKDFRPYAIGKSITEGMQVPEGMESVYENILTYKHLKSGEIKEFTMKNYPWKDSNWVWQSTDTKLVKEGVEAPIHDFNLEDLDGNDMTEDILAEPYILLVVAYDINKSNKTVYAKLNALQNSAASEGMYTYLLTASNADEVETFRHLPEVQSELENYLIADGTMLKTIIRSNPGVVLLKEGRVIGKWHDGNIPEFELVKKQMSKF